MVEPGTAVQDEELQYVTLCLGAEIFAVPVSQVREILDYRAPFRVPEGPGWLDGLIDVRGQAIPVIDLRTRLGLPRAEVSATTRIMVVDVPVDGTVSLSLGLVADRVLEVATFLHSQIGPVPQVGGTWRLSYIDGIVRRDTGFVLLFNIHKLMTSQDVAALTPALKCGGGVLTGAQAQDFPAGIPPQQTLEG